MKLEDFPRSVKLLQIVLGFVTGGLALYLWKAGWRGFIAFVVTFTITHMGVGVIYLMSEMKKDIN